MKKKNNKGFSLIELIIAIAILVILTGLLAPQFMRYMERSREAKDIQVLDTVYGAVQTALANEKAYGEVLSTENDNKLAALRTTGMSLEDLFEETGDFGTEFKATMGSDGTTKLWTSKAVLEFDNAATFVWLEPDTLRVTAWIGTNTGVAADAAPVEATHALSPTGVGATDTVKSAGTTFWISK